MEYILEHHAHQLLSGGLSILIFFAMFGLASLWQRDYFWLGLYLIALGAMASLAMAVFMAINFASFLMYWMAT